MRVRDKDIRKAVDLLRRGKLVAIPTETVYGLAADARNENAVKKIFKVKGRPRGHPLIVHLSDVSQLSKWASDISASAYLLAEHFWPGPLTFVLKRAPEVLDAVTGGQETLAVRSPKHPIAQEILREFGDGLAAPSANRFGHISPTEASHVKRDLGDLVDFIVDGGPCEVGVESTIIDLTAHAPRILRPGMLEGEMIAEVLGEPVGVGQVIGSKPRVSGSLPAHYAPTTPTLLLSEKALPGFVAEKSRFQRIGILSRQAISLSRKSMHWITLPNDPKGYAKGLYKSMRYLDELGCDLLVIEKVPDNASWSAIWDRLQRATKGVPTHGNRTESYL